MDDAKIDKIVRDIKAAVARERREQQKRKVPEGGWYKGPPATAPGRYVADVAISTPVFLAGLSDPGDRGRKEAWTGDAIFFGDKLQVEQTIHDVAWSCSYRMAPGAEARCRTATAKAVALLQAYYDRSGVRWEKAREAARRKGRALPKLPPNEAE